ncbi:hypothetical protein D3C81_1764040 [compost metagenome]
MQERAHLGRLQGNRLCCFARGGPHRVALEFFTTIAPGVETRDQIAVADAGQVSPSGRGVSSDGVGFGLGVFAAVAAGQQGQGRQRPGEMAQSRFHG